ncbi:unnamed protein product [Owenia fusiformis]|uniref:ADP-ribosyl cyclase/cyclic ADP-ribose hydrolase n=1 Tax=Owenia fusiformis TaxID=6347 RepID=A0A8J1TRI6_OWEFU|nr:unnamed protein product [Owenia fusiformis]
MAEAKYSTQSSEEGGFDHALTNGSLSNSLNHGKKKVLALSEIVDQFAERLPKLSRLDDYSNSTAYSDLRFIQRQTLYTPNELLRKAIARKLLEYGMIDVFTKVWQCSHYTAVTSTTAKSDAFKNLRKVISIIWNISDISPEVNEALTHKGVVELLLSDLNDPKLYSTELANEDKLYVIKGYLGILHNIIRLHFDSRQNFRDANAVAIIGEHRKSEVLIVRTKADLIMSYIISEQENAIINADDRNIIFIIGILQSAIESENHFSKKFAFHANEIVSGINHLASNDSNKSRIVKNGVLPLYVRLLDWECTEDEQSLAAQGLWTLAFDETNRRAIREEEGCIPALQELASKSKSEAVIHATRGALWVIEEKCFPTEKIVALAESESFQPHVMLSYQWGAKETMIRVKDKLKAAGYKVWMDVENMSGSTLEAMALAVERAAVVIVGMSQNYKDSPSCRTEAEYTYRLRKDIIPVRVQSQYTPDGWLGIMIGTRLYFDLSIEDSFDMNVGGLVKELGNRGRVGHDLTPNPYSSTLTFGSSKSYASTPASQLSKSSTHDHLLDSPCPVLGWRCEDVARWLAESGLEEYCERFQELDGELLLELKKMHRQAPEFFFNTLKVDYKFKLITMLKFTKALEKIQS